MTDLNKASEGLDAVMAQMGLSADQKKMLAAAVKSEGKSRRKSAAEIEAEYPHVVKGSMRFDPVANKQRVTITCTQAGCSTKRDVFTSDLFQVRVCEDHKKAERKANRDAQKALLEEFKKKQAELKDTPAPEAEAGEEIAEDAEAPAETE